MRKPKKRSIAIVVILLFLSMVALLWRVIFPKRGEGDETPTSEDLINTLTIYNPFMSAKKTAEAIIKKYEGYRSKAYLDTGGVATIGFGTIQYGNGSKVKMGDTITQEKAQFEFEREFNEKFNAVKNSSKVPLTDSQLASLVSFAYNVGTPALLSSTLWKKLQSGASVKEVASEFDRWVYDNGKVITGLQNRRASEKNLFLA